MVEATSQGYTDWLKIMVGNEESSVRNDRQGFVGLGCRVLVAGFAD